MTSTSSFNGNVYYLEQENQKLREALRKCDALGLKDEAFRQFGLVDEAARLREIRMIATTAIATPKPSIPSSHPPFGSEREAETSTDFKLREAEAEITRLKAFHIEDMRVTNESADFHIKECAKLLQWIAQAEADTLEAVRPMVEALLRIERWAVPDETVAEDALAHARAKFPKLFE